MRVSEEALYASDPLGSVPPEQIRAEILATGAPPQMTKDGPKPPTKKMIAAAAARKDSFLRAALDARRTRDAPVDWLVAPVCLGVLRRESSSPEHVRLAVEIVREATAIAPEDEPVLAETARLGLARRGVAAAAFGAAPSVAPGAALGGGSSSRATAHLQVLAACPPRVGAIVLWREREQIAKLVGGEGANANAADAASRAAAVVAVGAIFSRADAVEAVVRYAPARADATGARGDGARFLIDLWRRLALLAEDAAAPDAAVAAAANALALLLGPALADAHPAAARVLAAHARDPALHGEYTGSPFSLGGEKDASLADLVYGSKASANGARWVDDGWARSAARGEGVVARGPATSAGGDDPSGAASPTLAAIRLDLTMRVVARARNLAARGARLPPAERPIAAGALVAALCAALEHGARAGDGATPAPKKGTSARAPKKAGGGGGGRGVAVPSALSRLRDAARARAFDDPGGVVALVADSEAARKDLTRLASAGAEVAGEALLRTMASAAAGAGPRADPRACLAAGAGLLALSGWLAADTQPLDWVSMGTGALLAAVACDIVPEINGDEAAAAAREAALAASAARAEGAKRGRNDATRASSSAGPAGGRSGARATFEYGAANPFDGALTELDDASDEEDVPPAGSKSKSTTLNAGKEKPAIREAPRVPRRAGDAVAPLSRAAFTLAVADSLPSMPISQPLRAIRALVLESKRGLPSRRDVRVAVVARALAAHAALRTHPEAIVVMTPLGEIIGSFLEDDRAARRTAERKRNAAERAARAAGIELDMDDLSVSTIVDPATLKSAKKRAEAEEARRVAAALRADAAAADAAAAAPQFREELCVCAVEAVLHARPESGTAAAFKDEVERGAEKRAGWCQVALEAAATLRRAALWPPAATGGRRAASDAATRLIAHLCAATRALVAEGVRVEAPGVHLAAQRVLAALLQETALAQKEGAADDAAAACVAWLACAHLDFPARADPSKRDDDEGAVSASRLLADAREGEEDDALALEMSRAVAERAAQSAKQGGPHGPMVVAMVESLVRGGAARFARRVRAAAAQREAGSMFGFVSETGGVNVSEARHASPEAVSAAGIACVEVLGERCPALSEQLAFVLDSASSAGSLEDAGPATAARARVLAARLRAVAESARAFGEPNVRKSRSPVPSLAADPQTRAALEPPPILLAHLGTRDGAVSTRRWVAGDTRGSRREAAAAAAAAAADFAVLSAARDAVEAATRLVAAAARRDAKDTDDASQSMDDASIDGSTSASAPSRSAPTPLTGPSDPCWIEASHESRPDARVARVALRCRPPPPSNESGAAGSAGLAGTLQVGTHGPLAFADGTAGLTVELSGAAAREKAAAAARDVVGVAGVGVDGGGAFASMAGNAGHVGHVVSRVGVGADEETLVTVEVRVRAFERVALRPIVTFAASPSGTSGSSLAFGGGGVPGVVPADGAPAATLRCVPYEIPLADLLLPDDAMRGDRGRWERLWTLLPASFELAARVDRHAAAAAEGIGADVRSDRARIGASGAPDDARAALAAAAAALGGSQRKRDAKKKRSDQKKSQDALGVSRRPFARCGAYALGSAGASCERFAATTWDGEHILVVVFASGEGVRLEHRARSAATLAPVAANPRRWLAEIAGGVLAVADAAADAAGDASLFRPPVELAPETLARGPEQGDGIELHDAAAGEWKAMAAA